MRLLVVINPSARDFEAERRWPAMEARLRRVASVTVVSTAPDDAETSRRIRAALSDRPERVVAIGGDGTVHLVLNAVMSEPGAPPELAVIPFGTANNVAKSLGLPLDDFDALADVAVGAKLAPLDVGRLEARLGGTARSSWWLDSITVGMDADVLEARAHHRGLGGYLAYAAALAERAIEQQSLDVRVTLDGRVIDTRVFNMIINNVPLYAGELRLPGSRGDDGLLDVYLFNRREYASKLLSFAIKQTDWLQLGLHELLEDLTENQREHHARTVHLRLASPRHVQVDGEVYGEADELRAEVTGQLRFAVP